MFQAIFSATFATLIALLFNIRSKKHPRWYIYVICFFGIIASHFFIDYLYSENDLKSHMMLREYYASQRHEKEKTKHEIYNDYQKYCTSEMERHRDESARCFSEFECMCDNFFSVEDQQKSKLMIRAAFAAAMPTDPSYRVLAAILLMMEEVYSKYHDNWQQLDNKLHQAKYHAELYEHYRQTGLYVKSLKDLEYKGVTIKLVD